MDMCKKMKLDHLLTPNTRISSKWIKDLNARPQTINILDIVSKTSDISLSNIFSTMSPRARETKEKIKGTTPNYKAFAQLRRPST